MSQTPQPAGSPSEPASEPASEPPSEPASEPTSQVTPEPAVEPGASVPPPPPPLSGAGAVPLPPPPPPAVGPPPRRAAAWTGVGIAIGGVLALVAGFLQYVKLEFPGGTYAFTGLGSESVTGGAAANQFTPGNPGRTLFVIGIVLIVLGLLVVARLGRTWVGVVAVVASAIGVVLAIVALAEPSRDVDTFQQQARSQGAGTLQITGSIGIGAILATIGAVVALVAAILALVVRQRSSTTTETDAAAPPTAEPDAEPGLAS